MTNDNTEDPATLGGTKLDDGSKNKEILAQLMEEARNYANRIAELKAEHSVELKQLDEQLKSHKKAMAEVLNAIGSTTATTAGLGKITVSKGTSLSVNDIEIWKDLVKIYPDLVEAMNVSVKETEIVRLLKGLPAIDIDQLIESGALKRSEFERITFTPAQEA